MREITVLIPCYNEEETLPLLYPEICKVAGRMKAACGVDLSFIFVDDGSKDGTLGVLKELAVGDERVRYLSFSRNFGKEAAIFAGLQHATGDYVAVMDACLLYTSSCASIWADRGERQCRKTASSLTWTAPSGTRRPGWWSPGT